MTDDEKYRKIESLLQGAEKSMIERSATEFRAFIKAFLDLDINIQFNLYMFKFRKIFEDVTEKAAEQIVAQLEQENVIPAILIPIIDVIADDVIGITPSDK